jgi:hypothetical protein
MARIRICKEEGCQNAATTKGYCRLHYLRHWKTIHDEHKRAAARKLNRYIEHICKENPDDYMDVLRRDLKRPDFDHYVDEEFGADDELPLSFGEGSSEEEIERLIKKLKIEEGF